MSAPRIVRTKIRHVRRRPLTHEFSYRGYSWLVDLDALPTFPRPLRFFAEFRSADHVGDPRLTLRENVDSYLAEHGITLGGGHVVMLTQARVLGYVFNPLTIFWCHDHAGEPVCAIAEVHNTYGGRHRYLLRPDRRGDSTVAKQFYVSPFNEVAGEYHLHAPEPTDRLGVVIALQNPAGETTFVATMVGPVVPASTGVVLRALLTAPMAPLIGAARIRWQGLRLWRKGLPIVPPSDAMTRQPSDSQETPR